jgi:hypothetical protein
MPHLDLPERQYNDGPAEIERSLAAFVWDRDWTCGGEARTKDVRSLSILIVIVRCRAHSEDMARAHEPNERVLAAIH